LSPGRHRAQLVTDLAHFPHQPVIAVCQSLHGRGQHIDVVAQNADLGKNALELRGDDPGLIAASAA
jgi:hypothetical protein